jgi:hypothetical protein
MKLQVEACLYKYERLFENEGKRIELGGGCTMLMPFPETLI